MRGCAVEGFSKPKVLEVKLGGQQRSGANFLCSSENYYFSAKERSFWGL